MRVLVVGGTKFIGRRIVEELVARGDEVMVVHRGTTEPADLVPCQHVHVARAELASVADQIKAWRPDAIVDTLAMTRADADAVLPHLPDAALVLLSSMDVYQALGLLLDDLDGEPVPIDEDSPVRSARYPYRNREGVHRDPDYDKLDVEPLYLERGAAVLRLAMIYGEHDPMRREEFILRRVRAGRTRIPVGGGSWLWTRCYVGDVATAVLAAIDNPAVAGGQIFNVGEPYGHTMLTWARQILDAAHHDAQLVRVPDASLPEDMWMTRDRAQHLLVSSRRAADVLGWRPADPQAALERSVHWHLANPPADPPTDMDFSADDEALAAAG
ncbi:MAG: NAD-dependent epimerase/dehydratase family protein [Micromonosporaceae bacterium]